MVDFNISMWLSVGLFIYYIILFVFDSLLKKSKMIYTDNKVLDILRTKYKINIRTFVDNQSIKGFAWFKTVWINERVLYSRDPYYIYFVFFHELFHVLNHHKAYKLLMRFIIVLEILLLSVLYWYYFIVIFLASLILIHHFEKFFEDEANRYASKCYEHEKRTTRSK